MPTFDGSSSSNVKAWRRELDSFFKLHPVAEEEVVQIVALHLLDEVEDWLFGHLEHAKVTKYSDFFHKLRKRFDVEGSLRSPPATKVLVSGGEALAYFQDSINLLTYRVPCMI